MKKATTSKSSKLTKAAKEIAADEAFLKASRERYHKLIHDTAWVRGLDVGDFCCGVAWVDGKLCSVSMRRVDPDIASEPITLQNAARKMLSMQEVEIDLGLNAETSDEGTARWLQAIQCELP